LVIVLENKEQNKHFFFNYRVLYLNKLHDQKTLNIHHFIHWWYVGGLLDMQEIYCPTIHELNAKIDKSVKVIKSKNQLLKTALRYVTENRIINDDKRVQISALFLLSYYSIYLLR
jgi:hypothetical protein